MEFFENLQQKFVKISLKELRLFEKASTIDLFDSLVIQMIEKDHFKQDPKNCWLFA